MDSFLKPTVSDINQIEILHITDTHLFSEKNKLLLGVNTWDSYNAVLDAIITQQLRYDLVIVTGDLAQDGSIKAYQNFSESINRLSAPCVWLPGNHDYQPSMMDVLASDKINPAKNILLGKHWKLLLLDSQVLGMQYGMLSEYQLCWLERMLSIYPSRYAIIMLHHYPSDSGCKWLDQHGLENSLQLASVLERYPLASTIVCGHIHQVADTNWYLRRVLSSPSTCVQFKPHCPHFTIDSTPPGWRVLTLRPDGSLNTKVNYIDSDLFIPDLSPIGY